MHASGCQGRETKGRWHGGVGVFFGGAAAAPGWRLVNQRGVEETADETWLFCYRRLMGWWSGDVLGDRGLPSSSILWMEKDGEPLYAEQVPWLQACPSPGARRWLSLRGFCAPWGLPAVVAAVCELNRFNYYCSYTTFLQGTVCSVVGSPLAYPQYAACRLFAVFSNAGMKSGVIQGASCILCWAISLCYRGKAKKNPK